MTTNLEETRRRQALKQICHRMVMTHPEAICMAVIELDCGCLHMCGTSAIGQPVGALESYTRTLEFESGRGPVCMACARAAGKLRGRIIGRHLVWPGDEDEKPDVELRNLIGREVFGPTYEEPD